MNNIFNKYDWHILNVVAGREDNIEKHIMKLSLKNLYPFIPKRKLKYKKHNILIDLIKPLYSGYIFILCKQWNLDDAYKITNIQNVIKFIGGLNKPAKLKQDEIEMITVLSKFGVIEYSNVNKVGTKIKVISGPLKELEGSIISVDRRKQRAVVLLPLLNSYIKTSLSFEYLE